MPAGQVVGEIPQIAGRDETVKYFAENEFGVRPVERPADLKFKVVAENECYGGTAIHRAHAESRAQTGAREGSVGGE